MRIGKLDNAALKRLVIDKIRCHRPEVKTPARVGEDCAVIDFGAYNCVVSTDPITGTASEIGRLAVNISCNDIASNGIAPLGILLTVLLPPSITEEELEQMMEDAADEAADRNIEILGGHTEITDAVRVPVISATALGRQPLDRVLRDTIEPGDWFVMTKTAGIEGAGILASDYADRLQDVLTEAEIAEARDLLKCTSVVKEGIIAGEAGAGPMHDVTEGGLLGALWELCQASGVGVDLDLDKVPVETVTRKICDHFSLNPYRLISSGCMLITISPDRLQRLLDRLQEADIPAVCIGRAVPAGEGVPIDPPEADELFRVVKRETDLHAQYPTLGIDGQ